MILTIANKELKTLFGSPLAWFVLAVMQLILAWIFLARLDAFVGVQSQLVRLTTPPGVTEVVVAPLFGSAAILLLMAVPLLTMRLISEERRNQTMTFLISAPVSMTQIILGKFFGLMLFLAAVIGLLALMTLSLYAGGSLDSGLLASNMAGLLLLAASYAALGLYVSCLTDHPVIAAIGALGALLALWSINLAAGDSDSVLHALSLLKHYENFSKGLVDTFDAAYYLLFISTFLALAIRRLDRDRLLG